MTLQNPSANSAALLFCVLRRSLLFAKQDRGVDVQGTLRAPFGHYFNLDLSSVRLQPAKREGRSLSAGLFAGLREMRSSIRGVIGVATFPQLQRRRRRPAPGPMAPARCPFRHCFPKY